LLLLAVSARRRCQAIPLAVTGHGDGVSPGGPPRVPRIATARSCARR